MKNELNFLNNLNRNFKLNFSVLSIILFFEILSCESKTLIKKNIEISAHFVSKQALLKIEKAGGKISLIKK